MLFRSLAEIYPASNVMQQAIAPRSEAQFWLQTLKRIGFMQKIQSEERMRSRHSVSPLPMRSGYGIMVLSRFGEDFRDRTGRSEISTVDKSFNGAVFASIAIADCLNSRFAQHPSTRDRMPLRRWLSHSRVQITGSRIENLKVH